MDSRISKAVQIRLEAASSVFSNHSRLEGLVTIETEQRSGCPLLNIICAIDASGSMGPDESSMRLLIATMIECASRRGGGTYSQLHFANNAHFLVKALPIPHTTEDAVAWKQETMRTVGNYHADGATNTFAALVAITDLLATLPGQSVVFVATDGDPTCGDFKEANEIALQISDMVQRRQIDCGQFDCVMLGLGPLKVSQFETIGRGLHPDARFVQSNMSSIAGDIGLALGDHQMFPHAELRLHNCSTEEEHLHLRNVKYGQKLQFLVELEPGMCAAEFVADGAVLCESTCYVQLGETNQRNMAVAWNCAKLRANALLTSFQKTNDKQLLDQATACVAEFASAEADLVRALIIGTRAAQNEHAVFANYQQLNGLCRELTRSATQSQQDYTAAFDCLREQSSVPPLPPFLPFHLSSPFVPPLPMNECLVSTFTSASELLSKLNSGSLLVMPSRGVKILVVFSTRMGSYFYLHRTDELNPCCGSTIWCTAIRPYPKPVDKLPRLNL